MRALRGSSRSPSAPRDGVFRVVARIVGDDEAEDVTHDTLVVALHRLGRCVTACPAHAGLMCVRQPPVTPMT
jgi:hypothetical protein